MTSLFTGAGASSARCIAASATMLVARSNSSMVSLNAGCHVLPQPVSGRIGLWSKADSHVYFDDFIVSLAD